MRPGRILIVLASVCAVLTGTAQALVPSSPEEATSAPATVVWAVGDLCAPANRPRDCRDVAELIDADAEADAFLMLGDGQYHDATLGLYRTYYRAKVDALVAPVVTKPVPGNHEYLTPGAAGYFDYFGARAGPRGRGYYSFVLGGWRLVAANSNCTKVPGGCGTASPQSAMMRSALRDPAQGCELVYAHHPPFSDGKHGDQATGRTLFALTHANGGDLFLAGHDHNYQRFPARRPDGRADPAGTLSVVSGAGGLDLTAWARAQTASYRQNSAFGALRLTLLPGRYTGEFRAVGGRVLDRFSGTCS